MLSVSPLRRTKDEFESQREMEGFAIVAACDDDDFAEFSNGNLLESINFDDFLVGAINGDMLPDLEMDPEILAEFSISGGEESSEMNSSLVPVENNNDNGSNDNNNIESDQHQNIVRSTKKDEDGKYNNKVCSASGSGFSDADSGSSSRGGEEIVKPSPKDASKARKSSAQSKNSQGKRKVKVDWTPELHRRFVQAVEQLGVENAVPSKILEIMGIACLTRHNIASHLQKYRSHRKHLLAREAEAASWSQRSSKVSPWLALTLGYPQMVPPMHHFRPLHVWGHPTMDHSFMPMWPQPHHHLPHQTSAPPPPPTAWAPASTLPPPLDPSFWFQQRFGSPPVPGIPPHAMFNVDPGVSIHTRQPGPGPGWPVLDFHPSKESIDAAIEDVVSKPWLPLPLGLKAPALDSVLGELQRQGISKIPPSCA